MFRLTLIPFILIFGALFFGIMSYIVIKKIKKWLEYTVKKGAELASQQQQKWTKKEQRKKLPDILQKGFDQYEKLLSSHASLPLEWKIALDPIIIQAKEIIDDVAEGVEGVADAKINDRTHNKKLNSIRPFFNHTLDALLQFTEKLNSDYAQMNESQIDKARQNITVFKADLNNHQEKLLKAKRMDFDVLMDVIKARLGSSK